MQVSSNSLWESLGRQIVDCNGACDPCQAPQERDCHHTQFTRYLLADHQLQFIGAGVWTYYTHRCHFRLRSPLGTGTPAYDTGCSCNTAYRVRSCSFCVADKTGRLVRCILDKCLHPPARENGNHLFRSSPAYPGPLQRGRH